MASVALGAEPELPNGGGPPPCHVACVMDGNGRWATQRSMARTQGHAAGELAVTETVLAAEEAGVAWLTLFAFSTENWSRSQSEVDAVMRGNQRVIRDNSQKWHERNIRVRYMGAADKRIPRWLSNDINTVEALTSNNRGMSLTFAFNYGGRQEITYAVKALLTRGFPVEDVTDHAISEHLYLPEMPDVDLIIRTSGEQRLSNFLLWRAAYAELIFLEVLWPDFRRQHFCAALMEYSRRRRTFGRAL